MAVRIYHKDHGYVITADQDQIKMLLAKGGVLDTAQTEEKEPEPVITKPVIARKPSGTRKL
jgi:hypothetical protein